MLEDQRGLHHRNRLWFVSVKIWEEVKEVRPGHDLFLEFEFPFWPMNLVLSFPNGYSNTI